MKEQKLKAFNRLVAKLARHNYARLGLGEIAKDGVNRMNLVPSVGCFYDDSFQMMQKLVKSLVKSLQLTRKILQDFQQQFVAQVLSMK